MQTETKVILAAVSVIILILATAFGYQAWKTNMLIANGYEQARVPTSYETIWIKKGTYAPLPER